MSEYSVNLTKGAEIFNFHDKAIFKYNARMKVAGDSVKIQFFENGIMCGYPKNRIAAEDGADPEKEKYIYDPAVKFDKTGKNAKKRLYDLVSCNLNKHKDHRGKKQSFKFFTCTFKEEIKDLERANKEFKKFIQRLNYFFTDKEQFLEYVAVPELQLENDRGVWHYHVLFFNLPFIPVSVQMVDQLIGSGRLQKGYDVRGTLAAIWGLGSVDVCRITFDDCYNVAGYVAKYIGKGLAAKFDYAFTNGLLNKKRFLRSTGLFCPAWSIAFLTKEQRAEIFNNFKKCAKHFKKRGKIGAYFETWSCDNEFIGRMFGVDFRAPLKHIDTLQGVFDRFSYGFTV